MLSRNTGLWVFLSMSLIACSDRGNHQQGYVEGRYTYAASYCAGYLDYLDVHRGESVKQGQRLFVLNKNPQTSDLAQAKANAAAEKQTLIDLQLGERPSKIEALQEQIKAAVVSEMYRKKMFERNTKLYAKNAIGEAVLDDARAMYLQAVAPVKQLQADLMTATLGARINQQMAQDEKLKAAEAQVKKAQWMLSTKNFFAPQSGRVDETYYRRGEFIPAGQPVLSMLVPSEVKIIFYVPEPRLGSLKVGDQVDFICDGCQFAHAKIDYIASQAEYTPPVLYTQQARKNLTFRVEAAIPEAVALNYHPGQPVDITWPIAKDH